MILIIWKACLNSVWVVFCVFILVGDITSRFLLNYFSYLLIWMLESVGVYPSLLLLQRLTWYLLCIVIFTYTMLLHILQGLRLVWVVLIRDSRWIRGDFVMNWSTWSIRSISTWSPPPSFSLSCLSTLFR